MICLHRYFIGTLLAVVAVAGGRWGLGWLCLRRSSRQSRSRQDRGAAAEWQVFSRARRRLVSSSLALYDWAAAVACSFALCVRIAGVDADDTEACSGGDELAPQAHVFQTPLPPPRQQQLLQCRYMTRLRRRREEVCMQQQLELLRGVGTVEATARGGGGGGEAEDSPPLGWGGGRFAYV